MAKNFKVYISSAGSGKTYTLVREYLSLALGVKNPSEIRHILAITFTNKAAAEMKERIIQTLEEFSAYTPQSKPSSMFNDIATTFNLSPQELQERAAKALQFILHQYSDFAVSTIDKFNHKLIRSFAFDLQIPVNFDLQTDTESILTEAVDELLDKSGTDKELTKVLLSYIEDLLQEDKSWNIGNELMSFGYQLFNENIADKLGALKSVSLQQFVHISKIINSFITEFKNKIVSIGQQSLQLIEANEITHQSLAGGASAGIGKYFTYLSLFNDEKLIATSSVSKAFESGKLTAGKATPQEIIAIENASPELIANYQQVNQLLSKNYEKYKRFKLIKANLFSVAVLNELEKIIIDIKKNQNILLISEFNKIISNAIANEPAPYIYERLGERYKNYLIDEFQDTSVMQWRNLLPLINNSLSQGFFTMLVGDGKQSIYRWRNGEVEQFIQLPNIFPQPKANETALLEYQQALQSNYLPDTLPTNYRSKVNIINFNNQFFEYLSTAFDSDFSNVYASAVQQVVPTKIGGSANMAFFEGEGKDRNEWMLNRVLDSVKVCLEKGYQKKDIAIITRSNKDAANAASFLMQNNIEVISKESLLLNISAHVRFVMECLNHLQNPNNEISLAAITQYLVDEHRYTAATQKSGAALANFMQFLQANNIAFNRYQLIELPLFELCNEILSLFNLHNSNDVYIKFFMDYVFSFGQKSNSIAEWLVWWNNNQHKLSIVVPDGVNAVNILTIHKSKGLQFPIVILPYADLWMGALGSKEWTAINETEFPELKYALINHGSLMGNSEFAALYEEEKRKNILDQLNMLYVAFTRAEEHLFILSGARKNSLHKQLEIFKNKNELTTININEIPFFTNGIIEQQTATEIAAEFKATVFSELQNDWKKLLKTQGFETATAENQEQLEYGLFMHKIMSEITHTQHIDTVLLKYKNGINKLNTHNIEKQIKSIFNSDKIKPFFNGDYSIQNEQTLMDKEGKLFRPDCLAFTNKEVTIIDYKTGEAHDYYTLQLMNYAALLSQMGYTVNQQLLVYIDTGVIEQVA